MALALLLMPLGMWAQNTATLRWGDPNIMTHFVEVTEWTMNWSGKNGDYPTLSNPNQLTVTYSSSVTNVATIDASTGAITPVAIGSTVITASYAGGDSAPSSASYTLTYTDDRLSVEDLDFRFSSSTVDATYGDAAVNTPSLDMGKLAGAAITYSSSATGVATVDASGLVTVVGVGSTVISALFAGSDNIKPGSTSYTLTVAQKIVGLEWGTTSFTYDGNAHVPTATVTGLVGSDACTVTVDGAQTDAGTYTATASVLDNGNYMLPTANTTTFTIAKAASLVATAPMARALTYTGGAQELVTAGSATGGTLQYSLDGQTYSTAIPTGTDVGTYTIYYKVVGDGNHTDVDAATVTATISTSSMSGVSATGFSGTYDGVAHGISVTAPAGATVGYGTSAGDYNQTSSPTYTSVGSNTVYYQVTMTGYDDVTGSAVVDISAREAALSWSDLSFTYDGAFHVPAATVSNLVGSDACTVSVDGAQTDAGSYTAMASALSNANYTLPSANTMSFTIAKADATVAFSSKTVGGKMGEAFTPPTVTTSPAGLSLSYASSAPAVAAVDASTGAVTLIGEGSTTITATFAGSGNYNASSDSYTLTVEGTPNEPVEQSLSPIVMEEEYTMEEADFLNADGSEVDLTNAIINNILFTLKNTTSPTGDGYDPDEHCIVLNTVMDMASVNDVLASGVKPGSTAYASLFTGMTFLVPAGEGYIIVNSQEAEGVYLMVKVGAHKPVAINMPEGGDYSIPYLSDQPTYVYLWNGGRNAVDTRGKKEALDVRVRSVSYKKSMSANGIWDVTGDVSDDDCWYDLSGQRISQPVKKGVYIRGHRKKVYP